MTKEIKEWGEKINPFADGDDGYGGDKIILPQVTLGPEQQNEATENLLKADQTKRDLHIAATMACVAAAGRLQALTMKRYPAPGEMSVFTAEDAIELQKLTRWWNLFPDEKRVRLMLNMKELAHNVEQLAGEF